MKARLGWVIGAFRNMLQIATARHLAAEARAQASILPVLSRQLREASEEVRCEVENICLEFRAMADQARESVNLVSGLVDARGGEENAGNIIQDCRATMTSLIGRMESGTALYQQAIEQMEAMNASAAQVFQILEEVDKTTFGNRLVALNAKIEAVHIGGRGAAFEVVAEQISHQALRSSELTEQVGSILRTVTGAMSSATAEMKQLADRDRAEADNSRHAVEEALRSLEAASSKMRGALDRSGETSARLVDSIGKAVMGLQFQDRLSQRIGHVVESLEAMSLALSEPAAGSADSAQRAQDIQGALLTSYTMDSERTAHDAPPGSTKENGLEGGDVELF